MSDQIDVNDLVNGLLDQISTQARELAVLRVQLTLANKQLAESAGDADGDE